MIRTLKASTYAWLVLLAGFYSEGCFGLTDRSDARAQPAESGVELDVVTIDTPQRDGSTSDADAAVVDAIDRVDVSITPDMPSIIEDSGMCPMGTRACAMVGRLPVPNGD